MYVTERIHISVLTFCEITTHSQQEKHDMIPSTIWHSFLKQPCMCRHIFPKDFGIILLFLQAVLQVVS